nr:MAG TPA: hypothetical protein [Caudoviricetes sp.]
MIDKNKGPLMRVFIFFHIWVIHDLILLYRSYKLWLKNI